MAAFRTLALALVAVAVTAACATFEIDGAGLGSPTPTSSSTPTSTPTPAGSPTVVPMAYVEDCTNVLDTWQTATPSSPELHIVAVYSGAGGGAVKDLRVEIKRPGPVILVVSAELSTRWVVEPDAGTELLQVIHNGADDQTVIAPAGVVIVDKSGAEKISDTTFTWNDSDTAILVDGVETLTGAPVFSFAGCFTAGDIILGVATAGTLTAF